MFSNKTQTNTLKIHNDIIHRMNLISFALIKKQNKGFSTKLLFWMNVHFIEIIDRFTTLEIIKSVVCQFFLKNGISLGGKPCML